MVRRDVYARSKLEKSYVVDRLTGKVNKEEAKYRPHDNSNSKSTCAECTHYLTPGEEHSSCRRVAGVVMAEDTCDLFAARAAEGETVQPSVTINIKG